MSEHSHELEVLPTQQFRTVDLRNASTDSWTDVLADVATLARGIANTEFVPTGLRGSIEKVSAAILYGRELGLPPMTGLGVVHIIEGRAGISAEAMRSLILQAGHELVFVKRTANECVMKGKRKGSTEWTETSFTLVEATQIKFKTKEGWKPLTTKANWQNFPADMLLARATTRLARMLFPDVIHGMRSAEELSDMVATETVTVTHVQDDAPPTPAKVSRARKAPSPAPQQPVSDDQPRTPVSVPLPPPVAPEPDSDDDSTPTAVAPPPPPLPAEQQDEDTTEPTEEPTILEPPTRLPSAGSQVGGTDRAVSTRAVAFIQMQFERLGVSVRDEKLFWLGQIIGRDIGSSKELTADEGKTVANALEKCRDREALEEFGAES